MPNCQYLLRFDDICPTMNWDTWEAIERQLVAHGIRPILAVVPDNRDPKLMVAPPAPDFWDRVRRWQSMGYSIGLHGYQHVYVNSHRGLMKLTPHSEFTGLSFEEQDAKIKQGLAIFAEQGVHPDVFVAPSHSFDRTTLQVLQNHGLTTVSDGPWPFPHLERGEIFWVPQQLWRLAPKPSGVWTACHHPNEWKAKDLADFLNLVDQYSSQITDLASVTRVYAGHKLSVLDRLRALANFQWTHRLRPILKRCRNLLGTFRAQAG
jgi:predicted deacetylase